jgi:hypothetical protein
VALVLLRLLQVVALAFAAQMSGVAHPIADLVFHDVCAAQSMDGRPADGDDDSECPPGCPSCHSCAHAQVPYVRKAPRLEVPPLVTVIDTPPSTHFALPRGELPFVFRPPRRPARLV